MIRTTMPGPPTIEYETPVLGIEVRREADVLAVIIPPPSIFRQVLVLGGHFLLLAMLAGLIATTILILLPMHTPAVVLIAAGIILFYCLVGLVPRLLRIVQAARNGHQPAVVRVCASGIQVQAPKPWRPRERAEWPVAIVADVSCREAGALPLLMRYVRLQIVRSDDQTDVVLIPRRGDEPLAPVEDALRAALALPPHSAPMLDEGGGGQ